MDYIIVKKKKESHYYLKGSEIFKKDKIQNHFDGTAVLELKETRSVTSWFGNERIHFLIRSIN